jgi:type I restriction enzyme M protein
MKDEQEVLLKLWDEADKHLKLKGDKDWNELLLNKSPKDLAEAQQHYLQAVDAAAYWHTQLDWLQSHFPDAQYTDVTGLCKAADRAEYVEEQDYSLNAGRYVGVEIEDDYLSEKDFNYKIMSLEKKLHFMNEQAQKIEGQIDKSLSNLLR